MRALVVVIALSGCGRLEFDASQPRDAQPDSGPAVCGNGVCEGNGGELCSSCDDCVTLSQVCGNGACDPGEDGTNCYADCGPSPWPWAEGAAMMAALNAARTMGRQCPGTTMVVTAPAVTYDMTLLPMAQEYAWEAAHENWTLLNACNGRIASERFAAGGASTGWKAFGATDGPNAIAMLLAFGPGCQALMNPANTMFAGTGAYDVITAHAVMMR